MAEQGGEYTQGFVLLQKPEDYMKLSNLTPESSMWSEYARYESKKIHFPPIHYIYHQSFLSKMPYYSTSS